ncbi:MAG: ATP-dependent zinc protease [Bradymonadales bacterium]|nr:MAG: ATP-dependent zinc protease [Bradymonadales bacterium]
MGKRKKIRSDSLREIGWREWIQLPDLTKHPIKVKVDTGAQTSALHATQIKILKKGTKRFVSFVIQPGHKRPLPAIRVKAELVEKRHVRSSTGDRTHRPVIKTRIGLNGGFREIELTLVNRDMMGFRMLLGRQALRNYFLVNPARSYLLSRTKKPRKSP